MLIKRVCIVFLLLLVAANSYSQNKVLINCSATENVKKAISGIRLGMKFYTPNNQAYNYSAYVDTLEKRLNQNPTYLSKGLELLGNLTLQSFYFESNNPNANYIVARKWVDIASKLESAQDDFFISCTMHVAKKYSIDSIKLAINYFELAQKSIYKRNGKLSIPAGISVLNELVRLQMLQDIPNALKSEIKLINALNELKGIESDYYQRENRRLGFLFFATGDIHKSDSCYQCFENYLSKNMFFDPRGYIIYLKERANVYEELKQFQKALTLYEKITDILKPQLPKDESEYAEAMYLKAYCYRMKGDLITAIKLADSCLAFVIKNKKQNLALLPQIAELYRNSNQPVKYKQVASLLDIDHSQNINGLCQAAYMKILKNDFISAMEKLQEASTIADKTIADNKYSDDFVQELGALINLYEKCNDHSSVIKYSLKELEYIKNRYGEKSELYVDQLTLIAQNYDMIEDFDKSIEYYNKALNLINSNNSKYYSIISSLASALFYVGDYDKADELFSFCLCSMQENCLEKVGLLNSYTGLLIAQADRLKSYESGIGIARVLNRCEPYAKEAYIFCNTFLEADHLESLTSLNNLFSLCILQDSLDAAKRYLVELEQRINSKDGIEPLHQAMWFGILGSSFAAAKDYSKAMFYSHRELEISNKYFKNNYQGQEMNDALLTRCYNKVGDLEKAESCYNNFFKKVINKMKYQFTFMTEIQRSGYIDNYRYFVDEASRIAWEHQLKTNSLFVGSVYNSLLLNKGLSLCSTLELAKWIEEKGSFELKSKKKRIELLQNYLNTLERQGETDTSKQKEKELLEKELVKESKKNGEYTSFLDVTWKDIQNKLSEHEAAIELAQINFDNDSIVYAAVVLKKSFANPKFIRLFNDSKLLSHKLSSGITLREALMGQTSDETDNMSAIYTDQKLGQAIWGPLSSVLEAGDTIQFSPAGIFHNIAIEYLLVNDTQTASDRYVVNRLSSTRQLAMEKKELKLNTALLVGDLIYALGKQQLLRSKQEIKEIAQLFGSNRKVVLLQGIDGTPRQFKEKVSEKFACIHISTHGEYASSLYPGIRGEGALKRNWLLFSPDTLTDNHTHKIIDYSLDARDISFLDLRGTDIVTLSACVTGLGDLKADGVFGLQRGFKKAGVQTIVMSLWPVNERATEIMMVQFYKNLIAGQSKHDAFQNAKNYLKTCEMTVEYENKGGPIDPCTHKYQVIKECIRLNDPKYWAAFIMLD